MAKKDNTGGARRVRKHKTAQGETHEHEHEAGVLFGVKLDPPLAELLHRLEIRTGHLVETEVSKAADIFPAMGWFDLEKKPHLAAAAESPDPVPLAIELVRLEVRAGRGESTLPPYEVSHAANRAIARRLYRMIELEIVLPRVEALGVPARSWFIERHEKGLMAALEAGKYMPGADALTRAREGSVDALELWVAEVGDLDSRRRSGRLGELSADIGKTLAAASKAIANFRPYDEKSKVDQAYYLTVPFLLEARRFAVHA